MEVCTLEVCDKVDVLQWGKKDVFQGNQVFVSEMVQELQLSVRSLSQDRRRERLHHLLDGHILVCQLVLGGTDKAKSPHSYRIQVRVPRGGFKYRPKDVRSHKVL